MAADAWLEPPAGWKPEPGIPIGIKDIFHVRGWPTRAGSMLPPEVLTGSEGTVIRRLRAAGYGVAGKTTTNTFAYLNPPNTDNPRAPGHTPGGSSAGSAAAVADGDVDVAIGTQTAQSIIAPAAFCGVVGFKPSHGRTPMDGIIPMAPSLDVVGVLARTLEHAEPAIAAIVDGWTPSPTSLELVLPAGFYLPLADETKGVFQRAIAPLNLPSIELGWTQEEGFAMVAACNQLLHAELAAAHQEWFEAHADLYDPITAEAIRKGRECGDPAQARAEALHWRARFSERLEGKALVIPSQPRFPPLRSDGRDGFGSTTMPWSFTGLPCVSIAIADCFGLQLVGAYGSDEQLLTTAQSLSGALTG